MFAKLSCAVGAGLCVAAFPGSLAWLVPGAALGLIVVYENTTPEQERAKFLATACALLPGPLAADLRAFTAMPARDKARYLLAGTVPLRPDQHADDNGDGAAEGDTQPLARQAVISTAQPAKVSRPRWLEIVNDDMDRAPHALILGPSGAGKTTLATALMGDRQGSSVVISPKIAPGNWAGAEVVTLDDDGTYVPLVQALADLEDEKRRRIVTLRQHGPDALEPMTIVLDELQQLTTHVPAAGEFMVGLSSLGRELKMRIVGVGTTDDALNIRGWKASRGNYVRIDIDRDRRASLSDGIRTVQINTREILPMARAAHLHPWRHDDPIVAPEPEPEPVPPALVRREPQTITLAELGKLAPSLAVKRGYQPTDQERAALAGLLEIDEPAPAQTVTIARDSGDVIVNVQQVAPNVAGPRQRRGPIPGRAVGTDRRKARADRERRVRQLVAEGRSANEIDRLMPGERKAVLALVRRIKAEQAGSGGS